MELRNNLLRKMRQNLESQGIEKDLARNLANQAFRSQRATITGGIVGQGGQTGNVTIIQDPCDENAVADCKSVGKFRSINGQCNNLNGHGFQGSAGTAFTRYKVTVDQNDKDIEDPVLTMKFSKAILPGRSISVPCGNINGDNIEVKIEKPSVCGVNKGNLYVYFCQY